MSAAEVHTLAWGLFSIILGAYSLEFISAMLIREMRKAMRG